MCLPVSAQYPLPKPRVGTSTTPAKQWSLYASASGYLVQNSRSFVSPALSADRGWLHLEARYNYEDLETGSLWIGRNFSFGRKVKLDLTPMVGGVVGRSDGVAPGFLISLVYRRFSAATEGEYLIATDRAQSFFYTWSEISYSPAEWFQAGTVIQRTQAFQTRVDTKYGLLASFSYKNANFTTYVLDFWKDPITAFGIGFRF